MSENFIIKIDGRQPMTFDELINTHVYTVSELIDFAKAYLEAIWPGFTGYAEALPEPTRTPPLQRAPLFVVMASSGTAGVGANDSAVTLQIVAEVTSDAKVEGQNYMWAIKTLRSCVDRLIQALYKSTTSRLFGCVPGVLTWNLAQSTVRPAWQVQIDVNFEIPRPVADVSDFL